MVLLESENIPLGTLAPHFDNLAGIDGKNYSAGDFLDKKILIVVFMCNHCPYVQAVIGRLIAIQRDYANKGVQMIGINPNDAERYPDDSFAKMQEFAAEKGINFVYVRDDSQQVARDYKAQCTPDIFVYDSKRELIYHGRIDDNWKDESQVSKQELRIALDAYLHDGSIIEPQYPSMGCSIKWKE